MIDNLYNLREFIVREAPEVGRVILDADGDFKQYQRPGAIMPYFGGKLTWTAELMQVYDHVLDTLNPETFSHLDLFGGGGSVTYLIKEYYGDYGGVAKKCVYNDYDGQVANVLKVVKSDPEGLARRVEAITKQFAADPDSFYRIRDRFQDGHGDAVDMAAAKIYLQTISFNSIGRSYSRAIVNKKITQMAGKLDIIPEWTEVFDGVSVWSKHFRKAVDDFVASYDGHRFVFVDPPYMPSLDTATEQRGNMYDQGMSLEEHAELAGIIHDGRCTYILTHSDDRAFRAVYGRGDYEWTVMKKYSSRAWKTDDKKTFKEVIMVTFQR
jgi:site-specific DNA-adenine methylase